MVSTGDLLAFWGKARPQADAGAPYHPVVYHLLDVAAAADAILSARPLTCARAGELLGLEPKSAQRLLVALVALHDLGKFTPAFQVKQQSCWPMALGVCDPERVVPTHHTNDGYLLWRSVLKTGLSDQLWRNGHGLLTVLALAVFGHHGRPLKRAEIHDRAADGTFGAVGIQAATECAEALMSLLHPTPVDAEPPRADRGKIASWWVAGLVTVADWIGSNQHWFPYTAPTMSLGAYWDLARKRAHAAVAAAGLVAPLAAPLRDFGALTGVTGVSSPAQNWATSVPLPAGPVLIILEDVTGSGKTEAAQMLVHRLMVDGRVAGAYWAMPTQATANAMYLRQAAMLDALFCFEPGCPRPSLALAHGQAHLHEMFRTDVLGGAERWRSKPETGADSDTELPSMAACAAFLADDRRAALLADIGAGTIDQALLGVLTSRFNTVRLFGLADKVLVVDEAHAYDRYMEVEVHELLRFQAALGGCAIVLSATLPQRQREVLVEAWGDGVAGGRRHALRVSDDPSPLVSSTSYPQATVVSGEQPCVDEAPLAAAPWSRRDVGVRLVREHAAAYDHIAATAARGAAVAWVRNTVDDCLDAAATLRGAGLDPIVFHARFAQGDRQAREREIVNRFGPVATDRMRRGRVLVATQVIEQSLDLDFDAMVSDLAPVDLLIQRAGRLCRHPKRDSTRPLGRTRELIVLAPAADDADEVVGDWLTKLLPGTAAVYENVGILWRTVRVLAATGAIKTPDGLRSLIEKVYASDDVPAALSRATGRAEGKASADAATANYATLKVAEGYHGDAHAWVDDLRAVTRLGEEQTIVRLARVGGDGSLEPWVTRHGPPSKAWALSEVRLSARRVPRGSSADRVYDDAVDRVRADWGQFDQGIPVLPLVESTGGFWTGMLWAPERQRRIAVRYTEDEGLSYERAREADE